MFDSYHQAVRDDHTVTVAFLTAAFVFVPALVLISQPLSYLPAIGASALCIILAFLHSRNKQRALLVPPVIAPPIRRLKEAK